MHGGTPQTIMSEYSDLNVPQRRRSARLSPLQADNKMAALGFAAKRSITVRKIAPRKTTAPSEYNKENTPRRSESEGVQQKKPKVSIPGPVPHRRGSSSATKNKAAMPSPILPSSTTPASHSQQTERKGGSSSSNKKKRVAMPSPILPSSPPPTSHPQQPPMDSADVVWSEKARRSYSRLSDRSVNSPESRETLFGFEKLQTPEVIRRGGQTKTGLEVSGSLTGLASFTSLLEADDCASAFPELDPNIPGVTMVKEKRRRKKVQQINNTEMDELAAKMNAEFEEAECFELVVE